MADTIERLEVLIEANTRGMENALKKLGATTTAGLKPIASHTKEASQWMDRLTKGTENLGKVFGLGFGAGEIKKLGGEIASVIHEAATGASDFGGRVTSDMIPALQRADQLTKHIWDGVKGFVAEMAVAVVDAPETRDREFLAALERQRDQINAGMVGIFGGVFDASLDDVEKEIAAIQARLAPLNQAHRFDFAGPAPTAKTFAQADEDKADAMRAVLAAQAEATKTATKAFKDQTKALDLQLYALKATDREQFIHSELARADAHATTDQKLAIYDEAAALFDQTKALRDNNDAANLFAGSMFNALEGVARGTESATDALKQFLVQLAEAALQAELLGTGPLAGLLGTAPSKAGSPAGLLGSLGSALISALPKFAGGGSLGAGQLGIVGERGPELVRGPATISPANRNGGGAPTINITVNGARGNQEIQTMVARGVAAGLDGHDKQMDRSRMLAA